ncbi:hypothetical protein HA402_015837 [Bradysia odoriphaga]|nr:hypothetical protein HA402_015837 [Bradysia odoriphaga]
MKVDKAVCTNETMEDLYRAIRYETVFTALVENKILAIKRECDEKQRLKKARAHFKLSGLLSSKKICCVKHDSLTNPDLVLHQQNSKISNATEIGVVRDGAAARDESLMQQGHVTQNELFKPTTEDSIASVNYGEDIPDDDKIQIQEIESISSDKSKKITFQSGLIDDRHKIGKNLNSRRKLSMESSFSQNSSVIESYVSDESQTRRSRMTDSLSSNPNKFNLSESNALDHERHRLRVLEARSISAQCSPVFPRPLFRNHSTTMQVPCTSDDNQLVPLKLIRSQNDIDASIDSVNLGLASGDICIDANKDKEQFAMAFVSNCNSNDSETIQLDKTKFSGQYDSKQGFIKSFNQLTSQNQNSLPVITTIKSKKDALKLHRLMNPSIDLMTESKCASKSKRKDGKLGKSKIQGIVSDGSVENLNRSKRKQKRGHKCSDPLLIYPSSNGFQHCILSMPPNQPLQLQYDENVVFDVSLQMDGSRNRDLDVIMPSHRKHKHRHHHHHHQHHGKKVGKRKILVHDLDNQSVKVIDPDDLPQRARWTIIATACLLLIMCLLLVGVTLRMAPFIDDMVRQENERLMQESFNRAKFAKNFTETAPLAASEEIP